MDLDSRRGGASGLRKWVSMHSVFGLVVIVLALYFAWKVPKQKHAFKGISGFGVRSALESNQNKQDGKVHAKKTVNKSEEKCRRVFEKLFGQRFPSVRPQFLKNPVTNKCLELDGFCPSIPTPLGRGLAFEYDGIQHARYRPHFHRHGPAEFVYQQKRDTWKDLKCQSEGIVLIRIPHFIPPEAFAAYIKRELQRHRVSF